MKKHIRIVSKSLLLVAIAISSFAFAAGPSGEFLDIHPELKPDPDRPGAQVWQKPGFDRTKYSRVILEPLSIFLAADSEYKGFRADEVEALAAGFRDAVVQTLEPELPVVNVPGSGVLYVRAALTGVKLKKPSRGPLSYTPIGLVVTAAQDAAGKRVLLEEAKLEVEAGDAVTGESLAVIVDSEPAKKAGGNGEPSWNSVQETFRFYATRFKASMLAARAKND